MFPYALTIPSNLKSLIPQLDILINEHGCMHTSKGKNGITAKMLYFKSIERRTDFVCDLKMQIPALTSFGTRLLEILEK